MTPPHPAGLPDDVLLAACHKEAGRASGPGGQHRNRVATAVTLVHRESGVRAKATERRKRIENEHVAMRRLRFALAVAVRSEWTAPSPLWRERTRTGRLVLSPRSDDVPAMVAEALDALATHAYDGGVVAEALGVSRTQIVRLLKMHPPALVAWNAAREARGLRPLR